MTGMAAAPTGWPGFEPPTLDPAATQAWMRLVKAFGASFLLHVLLLVALPVNPTGGVPQMVSIITARLEPAASEPVVESPPVEPALREPMPAPAGEKPVPKAGSKPQAASEPPRPKELAPTPSAGIELPFIRDPTYYTVKQLDVYPQPLGPIKLDYPDSAASARVDGHLLVLLLIDEFGIVNEASIVEAKPQGYFEDATLAVFRGARFSPAQKQGHAVKSRVQLQVKYLYGQSAGGLR
jgi:periplasmic protein TonB